MTVKQNKGKKFASKKDIMSAPEGASTSKKPTGKKKK